MNVTTRVIITIHGKHEIRCKVLISVLPVPSTQENTHKCCDGYGLDAVKKDCVDMPIALISTKQITMTMLYPYLKSISQI